MNVETDKIKILIEPKMAFGTGTHETTKLMLEEISKHDFHGQDRFRRRIRIGHSFYRGGKMGSFKRYGG
jgi:ribosomal protein L11 methylase PrmA